jgi:hypothetical protein
MNAVPFEVQIKRSFRATRSSAERVGIVWRLSLEEFTDLWRPHWQDRKDLLLARLGYTGVYEIGNVKVDTRSAHVKLQQARKREEREARKLRIEEIGYS